ncbi:Myosin heavy chain, cardiac muscle beta isoform, putative, partial [Perkinsus marinus ATCC 50983]
MQNEVDQKDRQLYRAKRDTKKAMMKRERAEVALKVVEEDMKEVVEVAEKLAKESEAQESLLVEVKTEVEVFMAAFMKQESIDHHKKMDYRGLLVKSDEQQKELQALAKAEAAASQRERLLVGQREKLHHDTDAMRKLSKQALGEVQMKMAEEAEQRKRLERCGLRQKECRSAYEIIRNERSKYLKLIQTASQRISEMEEKYRLLNNEAEVLRGEEGVKEKALAKVRAEATKQRKIKEKLLKEYNSMTNTGHELNDEIEHNVACIDKSNSMIKKLERKLEDVDE